MAATSTTDKAVTSAHREDSSTKSLTIMQRRWKKFKSIKRGYYSFIFLVTAYVLSFFLPFFVGNTAIVVKYNDSWHFPMFSDFYSGEYFGQVGNNGECKYRDLDNMYEEQGGDNFVIMPLYPYSPFEDLSTDGNEPFVAPFESKNNSTIRLLGTDNTGRDVFARMAYGFRVSLSFSLVFVIIEYFIGILLGAMLGYFGGWFDLLGQRFIEIWSSLPMIFLIIIIVSIFGTSITVPFIFGTTLTINNFSMLVILLSLTSWIGITTLMRAEFYREKAKEYVAAAISIGISTPKVMFKHILPNTLVPIITFLPFSIVGGITSLIALDYLGFGLAPPTPSWGQMMSVGLEYMKYPYLMLAPFTAMSSTLILVVFIGESVREAFDPKTFSRLQ